MAADCERTQNHIAVTDIA